MSAAAVPTHIPRATRPDRPPVPALPALDELDQTHRQVLEHLAELDKLMTHLTLHGLDETSRELARGICAFFESTARKHHADEERIVFPGLLAGGNARIIEHVQRLQQDHGWLEEDWIELAPQLQAVAQGFSWYDIDTLRLASGIFTALYQDHIALEESMIYPAARKLVADQVKSTQDRLAGG
jgi:hemerythrin-like domain-containing protein